MQRSRHRRIALALTLACLVGLAGWLALVEDSTCDDAVCDAPCAVCVCCPLAPRGISTVTAAAPGVNASDVLPQSLGLVFADPPPDDFLHVPRRLSSFLRS